MLLKGNKIFIMLSIDNKHRRIYLTMKKTPSEKLVIVK